MRLHLKVLLVLFVMTLFFMGLAWLVNVQMNTGLPYLQSLILIASSFVISIVVSLLFFRSKAQKESAGIVNTLSSIVIKFILFLALLAAFAFTRESLDISFLVSFFILYLSYTFYLLFTFVSVLRSKKPRGADENGVIS